TVLYYGDVFTDHLVDDRSEYFKLPFNHRSDLARVPDWVHDAVVYNIFPDSFASAKESISLQPSRQLYNGVSVRGKLGGTLWGAAENAEYLQELGINCVYLNPIFTAGEYHKYDLLDYYHVDPCFGGDEAFRAMVEAFHQRGIRVIIDGVFNHCGWYFFAFDDVVKNQEASRYKDWFYHLEFPVVRPEDPEAYPTYACFGYERMMPKLDTANPEVRDYFCDVGAYWVREFGIDGWRLDVASEVDDGFWRAFRRAVKAENPEALLIGEVWESAGHWLCGDMFDSTMNYDFRKHCRRFFGEQSMDAAAFSGRLTNMLTRYRHQLLPAQLNLLDSHDVSRFLSLCGGDVRPYRLSILFLMSFVGMPTIFYGDELGIQGVLEAEYRSPMPWGGGDKPLQEFFRQAIAMRHELLPLRRGDFHILSARPGSRLLMFQRRWGTETVTVALNCSTEAAPVPPMPGKVYWSEGLEGETLAGFGFAVLVDGQG
ncbi:MAG: DUF3459 domain-containing protein, partial [Oscillospiraceae bacterium]|nr:DUF3459 domain-containing protein [Oscillospiraceae bacterium]